MAINLIDLAKGYLTDSVINSVSGAIGESADATRQAAGGAIPAVLGGLIKTASTSGGASMLSTMLDRDHDGSILDDLAGMLGGNNLSTVVDMGSGLLGKLFSGGFDNVASAIGGASGISSKSSSSLLKILTPIILGVVGKQKRSMGLDAGGLASMLMGQKDLVEKALPAGLSSSLGLSSLGKIGDAIGGAASDAANAGKAAAGAARDTGMAAAGAGGSMVRKLLPLVLLVGAVILLWPTLRGCGQTATDAVGDVTGAASEMAGDAVDAAGNAVDAAGNVAGDVVDAAGNAAGDAMDKAGDMAGDAVDAAGGAVDAAGEMAGDAMDKAGELADGAVEAVTSLFDYANAPSAADLGVTSGGVMDQFVSFLKTGEGMERTFTLDKVHFETGSNVLTSDSRAQLDEVAKVLAAYGSVKIELQGHTDNEGNDNSNQQLSERRAGAVKIYLESQGIAGDRMTAVGYGESKPMESNDTEAGRAKNRRTDIKVTGK